METGTGDVIEAAAHEVLARRAFERVIYLQEALQYYGPGEEVCRKLWE